MKEFLVNLLPYGIAFLSVGAFIGAIVLIVKLRKNRRDKWADLKLCRKPRGIVFGKKRCKYVCSPEKQEGHVAVFGGSGSGKTSGLLIPTLRAWRGNSFVIDISGDIEKNVPAYTGDLSDMRPKAIISLLGGNKGSWDVLRSVDAQNAMQGKIDALISLSFAILPSKQTSDDTSEFYQQESRKLLQASLISAYFSGDNPDFVDICKEIMELSSEALIEKCVNSDMEAAVMLASGFVGINERTLSATKQEVDKALSPFVLNESIKNSLKRNGFNPSDIEKKSIYLVIPDDIDVFAPLLRLVTGQMLSYLANRQKDTPKVLLCLDEFSSLGRMQILQPLKKLRKRGVRIMILTQSLADFDLAYSAQERRAICENIKYTAVMACNDIDTAKHFSEMSGGSIAPERFARLEEEKKLILFTAGRSIELKKHFYYNKSVFSRLYSFFADAFQWFAR